MSLSNIKNYCASCSKRIDFGNMDIEDYYNRYGNFCIDCNNRISKQADIRQKERQRHIASGVKRNMPLA